MEQFIINRINKHYGDSKVLGDISLKVHKGELLSILGESGSGKTTLLKIIAGLDKQDQGAILLDGEDISDMPIQRRSIAMVFQDYMLFPHLTAIENIEFGPKMKGVNKAVRRKQAAELMQRMQLSDMQQRYPHQLSGGQRQRVAIARALATAPKLLLLDEPFSSLDAGLRLEMCDFIKVLQRDTSITTILVTHDRAEAMRVSDRLAIIDKGSILQIGKPQEIYYRPNSIASAKYLGDINIIKGNIIDSVFTEEIAFRPEAVELFDKYCQGSIEAVIEDRVFTGERIAYTLKAGETKVKAVHLGSHSQLEIGQTVFFSINKQSIITGLK